MIIKSALFVSSNVALNKMPKPALPEYAFIGRSNVGKSSLINMLVGIRELAHTSSRPGKTQTINHFRVNDTFFLADLPGYGFAKVSQKQRKEWMEMIAGYVLHRKNLMNVFVLVDASVPPQQSDIEFINWLGEKSIPFCVAFTKTDKAKKQELAAYYERYRHLLSQFWDELPPMFYTSCERKEGREELLLFIEETNKVYFSSQN